ncbi:putative methyltransferase-domain-containing protein [Amylostereum chailletii]|nr:putative methyltransferase-domain-containing protein [Amylostereum chailletii]
MSEPEDILSSSLETLYDYAPITHSSAGPQFTYTSPSGAPTITLATPDTAAENWALHASSIWVSALYIADHLPELQLRGGHHRVLELGAGAGLPGILIAKTYEHVHVTTSDYPDAELMRALEANVARNGAQARCSVVPHAWGTDPSTLLSPDAAGFDTIVAADTLWNPDIHLKLIDTLARTLARTDGARAHLVAGLHTGRYTIEAFVRAVGEVGMVVESAVEREVKGEGRREWDVRRAEDEDERERRRWVVWMILRWP